MRYMGLDYGSKTVGVALSDPLLLTAQPFETIWRKEENKLRRTCARIEEIIAEKEVTLLVLGCPYHMGGEEGERVALTKAFGAMLVRRTGLPLYYVDERLTTMEADEILSECGVRKEDRKAVIDQIAAARILETYMASQQNQNH